MLLSNGGRRFASRRRRVNNRRAARKDDAGRSRFFHVVRPYGRRIGDNDENTELGQLLHDEVVELRPHRKEEEKMLGLPHPHLLGNLAKGLRGSLP